MTAAPGRPPTLSAVKLALAARQRRGSEDAALLWAEPIAVIGVGCRFPGGATSPDRYWDLLREGVDAVREVPRDRWNAAALYDPHQATPGKLVTRQGSFLDEVDSFDPAFFGIAPREATTMDPQQRLLLEVAWEALEDAGLVAERLAGSRTGVFVASYNDDYGRRLFADAAAIDAYTLSGSSHSITSGRLSFLYDLKGPSIAVDTACSASLVAVHLACQSLRSGECDLALTGGVSLVLGPEGALAMSKWGMLAPDGRSKTFDASADGFGRGEGCGVAVLKRLSEALADGDPVRAVIRGSAVNQDGRSAGLTAPNGLAQEAVVRQALGNGRVDPAQIGLIEAHGTGTALGDPIEAEALAEVLGRAGSEPCALASVKTNFGHLEAAAGIAGLIKLVLALEREAIPPHLHFRQLSPHISFEGTRFFIPTKLHPWPRGAEPRFAGVSSFGFGGTNAHVVLEEAPRVLPPPPADPRVHLLPLSAHTPAALRALAERHAEALTQPSGELRDICYTASVRRTHHPHRIAVVGESAEKIRSRLEAYLRGEPGVAAALDEKTRTGAARIAFVFSGQGPQWWAMGRELLETDDTFRGALEQCEEALLPHTSWSLLAELRADEAHSRLGQTEFAQPALFALQVALAALWRSWGIVPRAVVGHSVGEIAAACVAGALSLHQAARLVRHRGRIMQQATGLGKMAAVELPADRLLPWLADFAGRLSLAAVNGPASCVVSGETGALAELLERLTGGGVACKRLAVDYAFHSPQMEPFQAELASCLDGLAPTRAGRVLVSSVTGEPVEGPELHAGYWAQNLRAPVRFAAAVDRLLADGHTAFVELSPHPVLSAYVVECARARGMEAVVLPSLRRGQPERASLLGSLGSLYALGATVDWPGLHPRGGRCVALPSYPWQRERYWFALGSSAARAPSTGRETGHRMLGRRLRSASPDAQFEAVLERALLPYLGDHEIFGAAVLPATASLEAALAAAAEVLGPGPHALQDVTFEEPLLLDPQESRLTQLVVRRAGGFAEFELFSQVQGEDDWVRHVRGRIGPAGLEALTAFDPESIAARLGSPVAASALYETLLRRGLAFGPRFRGIVRAWLGENELLAELRPPIELLADASPELLLPPLLDACLQGLNALPASEADAGVFVPLGADRFELRSTTTTPRFSHVVVRERPAVSGTLVADVRVIGEDGSPVAEWVGLRVRRATAASLGAARRESNPFYELEWRDAPLPSGPAVGPTGTWLICEDQGGVGEALAAHLAQEGAACVRVRTDDRFAEEAPGLFRVDPGRPQSFVDLFERLRAEGVSSIRGAFYLWALDEIAGEDQGTGALLESQRRACGGALHLVQALARLAPAQVPRLLLATRGAQEVGVARGPVEPVQAALLGLRAAVALEHPELHCATLDLDPAGDRDEARALLAEGRAKDGEGMVALREGKRRVARLVRSRLSDPAPSTPLRPQRLETSGRGELDRLVWRDAERRAPGAGEVEIQVAATGLNFRDVLNGLGLYPGDPGPLGDECSGVVTAVGAGVSQLEPGDEVMAFVPSAFSSYVTAPADLAVRKPSGLGLVEAAAVPIAFMTAEHCLVDLAALGAGQTVLIHAAAGGVGLAAVEIAQRRGAEIFATAGSPEKRAYLESLGVRHVMDSRSLAFADEVMSVTNGRGVDVVLNSLAGESLARSLSLVRRGGSFLEIGKTGIWSAEQVAALGRDIRYHVVFLGAMREHEPDRVRRMLGDIAERLAQGRLKLPPVRAFARGETVEAFRYMSQARHIGKIVVTHAPAGAGATVLRADATYLITGGLGGVGLRVARALASSGARHLVLVGRSAPGEAARAALADLERMGVHAIALRADVSREEDVARLLAEATPAQPPLRGVIHAAGVLDDGVLAEQDWARFARVLAPKALGAWNLHRLTRGFELDFFVCFSSAASWLGWAGQGTYGAANAFLDGLAQRRRALGLPGLSLVWGPWADVGMAAGLNERDRRRLEEHGFGTLAAEHAATLAVEMLAAPRSVLAVLSMDWEAYAARFPDVRPPRLVAELVSRKRALAAPAAPSEGLALALMAAAPSRRRPLLLRRIEQQAARILGLDPGAGIDPGRPLRELGLDSLMAVEIRNTLAALVDRSLPATLLFEHPTLDALADYLLGQLVATTGEPGGEATVAPRDVAEVAALSDAEAEALLVRELDAFQGRTSGG